MLRNGWYIVSGLAVLFVLDKIGGALWFADGPFRWSGLIGEAFGRGLGLLAFGYLLGGGVIYVLDRFVFRRARFANPDTRPRFRNGWYCLAGIALWWIVDAIGAARIDSVSTSQPVLWLPMFLRLAIVLCVYAILGTLVGGLIYVVHRGVFQRTDVSWQISRRATVGIAVGILALIVLVGAGLSSLPRQMAFDSDSVRRYAPGPSGDQQRAFNDARSAMLILASRSDQDGMTAGVVLGMFADRYPWSEIDAIATKNSYLHDPYERFRNAARAAGYDPLWTEEEHLLRNRYDAVFGDLVQLRARL
ncbi:MAG: hypothetical protein L0219_06280, partial [Phycisphaerales bacterium]|nr:hypothetical protein [Phycisphaerales bacterium]